MDEGASKFPEKGPIQSAPVLPPIVLPGAPQWPCIIAVVLVAFVLGISVAQSGDPYFQVVSHYVQDAVWNHRAARSLQAISDRAGLALPIDRSGELHADTGALLAALAACSTRFVRFKQKAK